jgi:MtN3 and saliva related transmembrane protein
LGRSGKGGAVEPDWIGWLASSILVATLLRQIVKQAQSRAPQDDAVSKWLFVGQCAASAGFVIYSVLVHNWVFIVTNSCVLITAIAGQIIVVRRNRK